jgi:putative transposase
MQDKLLETSGHAGFALQYHIVFITRYRHKCLTAAMLRSMKGQLIGVCLKWRCELREFNGEDDHVHLLVSGHPAVSLGRMVGNLKTVSARKMRSEFAAHLKPFYWKPTLWSSSYAVFSVGSTDLQTVVCYIQEQESPAYPATERWGPAAGSQSNDWQKAYIAELLRTANKTATFVSCAGGWWTLVVNGEVTRPSINERNSC